MFEPLVPELAEAIVKERRDAARAIGRARDADPRAGSNPLKRFLAARLAGLAATIDSEAAEAAVCVQEGHSTIA